MSHISPAALLVWTIAAGLLLSFLLFHLWSFDRFRCLRWNNGPYSGAFKRIMTYTYTATMPLIIAYALGFCVIKYEEGYVAIPGFGIVPKPYQLWTDAHRQAIFPLTLMFSFGWSFEMITHLEELCFWLFLVNARSNQQNWFRSPYFRIWTIGSIVSVVYLPLITILSRSDPLKSEAYTFLAGSLGSLLTTLWFLPVLWSFPTFLDSLRHEAVDLATIVRLTKFHELNTIRVIFRFLFCCPLVILGIDGVRPHEHINESLFWTDLLAMLAAFGCAISSGITLVIFFPRSIEGEIAAKDAARDRKLGRSTGGFDSNMMQTQHSNYSQSILESAPTYLLTSSPVKHTFNLPHEGSTPSWDDHGYDETSRLPPLRPNRRIGNDIELGGIDGRLAEADVSKQDIRRNYVSNNSSKTDTRPRPATINPFVTNFTSPIDLVHADSSVERSENVSRLTFNRFRR